MGRAGSSLEGEGGRRVACCLVARGLALAEVQGVAVTTLVFEI